MPYFDPVVPFDPARSNEFTGTVINGSFGIYSGPVEPWNAFENTDPPEVSWFWKSDTNEVYRRINAASYTQPEDWQLLDVGAGTCLPVTRRDGTTKVHVDTENGYLPVTRRDGNTVVQVDLEAC